MPELCRFFGIIIRMFSELGERHHAPHFHAYYGDHVAVFAISPPGIMVGSLPLKQQRQVEDWLRLHTSELLADCELLKAGRKPAPIQPLK